jgi:hypothetical protein
MSQVDPIKAVSKRRRVQTQPGRLFKITNVYFKQGSIFGDVKVIVSGHRGSPYLFEELKNPSYDGAFIHSGNGTYMMEAADPRKDPLESYPPLRVATRKWLQEQLA